VDRFVGEIILWSGAEPPRFWLRCDGSTVPYSNPNLYKLRGRDVQEALGLSLGNGGVVMPNIPPDPSGAYYIISSDGVFPFPYQGGNLQNDPYLDFPIGPGIGDQPTIEWFDPTLLDVGIYGTLLDIKMIHAPQPPVGWIFCDGSSHSVLLVNDYSVWTPYFFSLYKGGGLSYGSTSPSKQNIPKLASQAPGVNYITSFRGNYPDFMKDIYLSEPSIPAEGW